MELKYDDVFYHRNLWWWGESVDIVRCDGTAVVCVKYDKKTFPKHWTVIDIGCAYNPQSYLFQSHARHIAIEPVWLDKDFHFEYFKAPKTELLFMNGQTFIKDELPKLDLNLKTTFCIVNFVPSDEVCQMARNIFPNIYTFYPAS